MNGLSNLFSDIQDLPKRFYRPGITARGFFDNVIDYVGDLATCLGALVVSVLILIISLALFATWFAVFFFIIITPIIFMLAKAVFYQPKQVIIDFDDDITSLEYVKEVHMDGNSEFIIHSQPGYGKGNDTYLEINLVDAVAIKDCRNITCVIGKSSRDIEIRYFHPVPALHKLVVTSKEGPVECKVKEKTADYCRIYFDNPLRKQVRIEIKKITPVAR